MARKGKTGMGEEEREKKNEKNGNAAAYQSPASMYRPRHFSTTTYWAAHIVTSLKWLILIFIHFYSINPSAFSPITIPLLTPFPSDIPQSSHSTY